MSRSVPAALTPADIAAGPSRGYTALAWGTLGFNLLVIVWGAFVRASGSGAGCGSHWPLCNGEIVPRAPAIETLIELGHRTTSGVALLLVIALVVGAWRRFPARHPVRRAAAWSMFFIITEALIGAGLVLLEMVADNASVGRGFWVAGHLVNTFLLVGALTVTAQWATVPPVGNAPSRRRLAVFAIAMVALIIQGVSGAVTALGDTLFPATSLAEAKLQTFSETAHVFIRLRIWHPTLALLIGLVILAVALYARRINPSATVRKWSAALIALYLLQVGIGFANVWLLAPIPIQLVHLLISDFIWMALVLLTLASFEFPRKA